LQVQVRAEQLKIETRHNNSVLSPFEAEALRSTIASRIRELCLSGSPAVAVLRTFPGFVLEAVKEMPGIVSDYDDDRQAAMAEIIASDFLYLYTLSPVSLLLTYSDTGVSMVIQVVLGDVSDTEMRMARERLHATAYGPSDPEDAIFFDMDHLLEHSLDPEFVEWVTSGAPGKYISTV
jgi:hypothetical protein